MAEEIEKVKEAGKAGWEIGREFDEATGASDAWSDAAVQADPELARSAADDWDKGDHAKAVGKFVRATGEAAYEAASDFFSGVAGEVEPVAPPVIELPAEEEHIGPITHVEHETMP